MASNVWTGLKSLREKFLAERPNERQTDYWANTELLELYDRSFAARIGWKWESALGDLKKRVWTPHCPTLFDWGCGTAIASRTFMKAFPNQFTKVVLWDRSEAAMDFAEKKIKEEFPAVKVERNNRTHGAYILLSHVLNELNPITSNDVLKLIQENEGVFWVEPGTYEISRKLIEHREEIRKTLRILAPCPHHGECGMLAPQNQRHWCHQFGWPPAHVFQDPNWGTFAKEMGIDLRSLPVSFLFAEKAPFALPQSRRIGRPRHYKGYSLSLECELTGVSEKKILAKTDAELIKKLKDDPYL